MTPHAIDLSRLDAKGVLNRLWHESPLPAHDIVTAVAALIFLRWADFQEAEQEAIAAFEGNDFRPVLPNSLHWRSWHQFRAPELKDFFITRLPFFLESLSNSRHVPLATHLSRTAFAVKNLGKISRQSLDFLIHWLADQPFETPADRRNLLDLFDTFLDSSPDKFTASFRTPANVARLMIELAAPVNGEHIYDPCFGTAGLLTSAIDHVLQSSHQKKVRHDLAGLGVSGVEQNESAYIIGLTRLVLACNDDPKLETGNSLERIPPVNPQQEGFNMVVANPPFGWTGSKDGRYGQEHYPIPMKDNIGLFVQHALSHLRPNGRAVIAVPNGILFRGGAERKLREWLVGQHTVEAVISLPETAFLPGPSVQSSLLILRRGGATRQIRMVDAVPFFEKGRGKQPATITETRAQELAKSIRDAKPSDFIWDVDVETLAKSDFDLTPRRRDQSNLTTMLETLRELAPVVQLRDCCQISLGRSIPSADLVHELPQLPALSVNRPGLIKEISEENRISQSGSIPYIRIRDIDKGQANSGSAWLTAESGSAGVESGWKLRIGDVLLSRSGTIGKVGIVRNGAVGAIAASGLYVLRADGTRLDPHYLTAYLDSNDCRAWLKDRASGAVIRHLSRRMIEEIPVPLPSLQIQQRIFRQWREYHMDALACLSQLLSDADHDPIAEWVEQELKALPSDSEMLSDPLEFARLDQLAIRILPLCTRLEQDGHDQSKLFQWLLAFSDTVSILRGISTMPPGPGLLSVLQESLMRLKKADATIPGHLPNAEKARKLMVRVVEWLGRGVASLLDNVQLVFRTENSTLELGAMQELDLVVQNKGLLPLREIVIAFQPEWGHCEIPFLAENGSKTIGLQAQTPKMTGPFMLQARWSALTLDGRRVDGIQEIGFDVLEKQGIDKHIEMDMGPSPYICGDPIRPDRKDVFWGREELLAQIRRQIMQSGNVVLLEGNRRSGKSSILRHLEGVGPIPGWLGVYCSLQGAEGDTEKIGVPTATLFREIAASIASGMMKLGIDVPLPDGSIMPAKKKIGIAKACRIGISDESPFADFREYVETALDTVAEHQLGILLMLDEFDKLQEGIDNGVTSPQVPENIRYLIQTYPGFSAILTGSCRLKRLRESYWSALYGLGTRFGVTSLSHQAASSLVTEPVKGRLTYSRESMERVISLTNGQPYLLQCLCNRIFDMAARLKIRSVTLNIVDQAGDMLAENNEHFASLWDYARSDRRRFILVLIHMASDEPDSLRLGLLQELLSRHGIEVTYETLIADLEFLRELELVELIDGTGSGHYALSIPLMGRWISQVHDFEVLKKQAQMETEDHHD